MPKLKMSLIALDTHTPERGVIILDAEHTDTTGVNSYMIYTTLNANVTAKSNRTLSLNSASVYLKGGAYRDCTALELEAIHSYIKSINRRRLKLTRNEIWAEYSKQLSKFYTYENAFEAGVRFAEMKHQLGE